MMYDYARARTYYMDIRNDLVYICRALPREVHDFFFFSKAHFSKHLEWFCSMLLLYTATMVWTSVMPHFLFWNECYWFASNSKWTALLSQQTLLDELDTHAHTHTIGNREGGGIGNISIVTSWNKLVTACPLARQYRLHTIWYKLLWPSLVYSTVTWLKPSVVLSNKGSISKLKEWFECSGNHACFNCTHLKFFCILVHHKWWSTQKSMGPCLKSDTECN